MVEVALLYRAIEESDCEQWVAWKQLEELNKLVKLVGQKLVEWIYIIPQSLSRTVQLVMDVLV